MSRRDRSKRRGLVWSASFGVGCLAVLLTSLVGLWAMLIGVPLLFGRERWVAASGFLSGFGVLWCALIVRQLGAGAERDGLVVLWLGVGFVPIAIGTVVTTTMALHRLRAHRTMVG
jgi:hypothetical protein